MGTKVDSKSYLSGFYSMRDLNEDSSSSSWPVCYGDKTVTNGHYYNGSMPRNTMDGYPGCGNDAVKHKMIEHEAVFKNQVYELHRVYRIQRDMMEDFRRKELYRSSMEPSSSSSLRGPQVPSDEAPKWHMAGFPLLNSTYERTSISGVEITNSPVCCTKGNSTQPNQFPYQNGSSVKDSELLDSRPLKLRKKLFDLELPADEYMDTEEGQKSPEFRTSHLSSDAPNVNLKSAPEIKKFPVRHTGATTTDCRMDVSTSASCSRNPIWLADLNEPIDVEEATAPSSTDFLDHSAIKGHADGVNPPAKSNAGFLGVNAKTANYRDGVLIKSSVESQVNDRGPLSHIYEAGSSKSNLDSVNPGLQLKNSHLLQRMIHPYAHTPGIYPTRHSKEDLWGEGNRHHLEFSGRSCNQSNNRFVGPHISSHAPGSDTFFRSSYFSGTWAHAVSSWAKPTESFTHKITSSDSYLNPTAAMNRGLQISEECRDNYGGKWLVGDDFRSNPCFGSDLSTQKGFYHGSASESKELNVHSPSVGFDYLNCGRGVNLASNHRTNHGLGHFANGTSFVDSKPVIDINLNEVVSKSSSNKVMILKNAAMMDEKGKPTDHLSTLPWLKNKPANANGAASPSSLQASSRRFCCRTETVRDLNEPVHPVVSWASSDRNTETTKNQNVKKILGFPIFETGDPENEPESHVSTSASFSCPADRNIAGKKRKNIIIDINLACEPEEQIFIEEQAVEKENWAKSATVRDFIDLNSCITDCEDTLAPSYESKTAYVKAILEIDLESPVVPDKEDENTAGVVSLLSSQNRIDCSQDEALRTAAEAIVSISSSCPKIHTGEDDSDIDLHETSLAESFVWFVNIVSSCPNELKSAPISEMTAKDGSPKDSSEEMDDFEAMTLQIPEAKEEDYMPTPPFIPEVAKAEDTTVNALARPRRGQPRRGRQRRDFQRDILPGLTSLSRLEVAEDIQTFGGMMRATGHQWISGVGRRNGGGRGRRRVVAETASPMPVCTPLMQQLSKIEAGLEDRGWGKTPRRPRRQRCQAAGNPPAVVT